MREYAPRRVWLRRFHALLHLGPLEPLGRRLTLLASLGLWPRVVGRRHVPRRGPLVVAASHVGQFDLLLLSSAVRLHLEIVLAGEILKMPLLGPLLRLRGAHPLQKLDFGYDARNAATIDRAASSLRAGGAVAIYPQGFQSRPGGGVARLAAAGGAPVLPVLIYQVNAPRASPRVLVVVRRPLPPPAPEARPRRKFRARLHGRLRAMGALRPARGVAEILGVALDAAAVWRDPGRVIRVSARAARLPDAGKARLARRARRILSACRILRCSVGDLRRPFGPAHLAAYLALLPPAAAGAVLCAPPLLYLRVRLRRLAAGDRRAARLHSGLPLAGPWGLLLALAGTAQWGAAGLALPLAALAGLAAFGGLRRLHRRLCCSLRARSQRRRLLPALAEFDRAFAAAVSPVSRPLGTNRATTGRYGAPLGNSK